MSLWMKADFRQVYIHVGGDVFEEHLDCLKTYLFEQLRYGYSRIVMNIDDVNYMDDKATNFFVYLEDYVVRYGGELILEDKNGISKLLAL